MRTVAVQSTSSATWVELWELRGQQAWANAVAVNMAVTTPVGTTAEVRLQITNQPGLPTSAVLAVG
jgi:hypothetical protein